jgi:hypothetical protein
MIRLIRRSFLPIVLFVSIPAVFFSCGGAGSGNGDKDKPAGISAENLIIQNAAESAVNNAVNNVNASVGLSPKKTKTNAGLSTRTVRQAGSSLVKWTGNDGLDGTVSVVGSADEEKEEYCITFTNYSYTDKSGTSVLMNGAINYTSVFGDESSEDTYNGTIKITFKNTDYNMSWDFSWVWTESSATSLGTITIDGMPYSYEIIITKEVTDLKAIPGDKQIQLTWKCPQYDGIDCLLISWIKKGTAGAPQTKTLLPGTETHTIFYLTGSVEYSITVQTVDMQKNLTPGISVSAKALGSSSQYTQIFYDDFDRGDSESIGNGWLEMEGQGSPVEKCQIVSGKAVLTGGLYKGASPIIPQMFHALNTGSEYLPSTSDWRTTIDIDPSASSTIDVWATVMEYEFFTETSFGSSDLNIRIRKQGSSNNGVSNTDTFAYQSTDKLAMVFERSGSTLTLTLKNLTKGTQKTVTTTFDPSSIQSNALSSMNISGGGYDTNNHVSKSTAIDSINFELKN